MKNDKNQSTSVREVEYDDLDEILGTKASTVIAPDEDSKRSVLENTAVDSSFLDMPNDKSDGTGDDKSEEKPSPLATKDALSDILDDPQDEEEEEENEYPDPNKTVNKGGRKPALIEAMSKLVEKGVIDLFEDQQDLTQYTIEDIEELIELNIATRVNETATKAPMEIFSRLDPKLQDVVAYALNGGQDIVSVLKNVARTQEITELSTDNVEDQERIVREWLRETKFGNDEEIEDEITSYIDRGDLEKKAGQFKPKLDQKQAEIMQQKLADQEEARKNAEEAKKNYAETIFKSLNRPDLNGLPLNNRVQTALYYGITDTSQFQDRDGNPTNELGHLIEQYQFGKDANPSILLEALWLMKDPNGYRQSVLALGEQKAHSKTFRSLKTAEGERTTSSPKQGESTEAPNSRSAVKRRTTGRRNIFSRD